MKTWSCLHVGPLRKDSTARAIQNSSVEVSEASFIAFRMFDNNPSDMFITAGNALISLDY